MLLSKSAISWPWLLALGSVTTSSQVQQRKPNSTRTAGSRRSHRATEKSYNSTGSSLLCIITMVGQGLDQHLDTKETKSTSKNNRGANHSQERVKLTNQSTTCLVGHEDRAGNALPEVIGATSPNSWTKDSRHQGADVSSHRRHMTKPCHLQGLAFFQHRLLCLFT